MRKLLLMLLVIAVAVPVDTFSPQANAEPLAGSFDDAVATHPKFTEDGTSNPPLRTEITQQSSPTRAIGASLTLRGERGAISSEMPSAPLVAAGFGGQGVRVGVIDFFDPSVLATQIASGELPAIPTNHRRCFSGVSTCPFGAPGARHGNAVAEIIAEAAPDAEFFLAEVGGLSGYYAAIDWFAANNVKVINHSLIGAYDGPGDGTGPQGTIVDYAVAKGMAWFNSAGDGAPEVPYGKYRGGYWRGTWSDPNGNGFLNFSGTDETLGTYCGSLLGLRWSDWGASRTDYELWIGDFNYSSGYATASIAADSNQAAGAAPLEGNDFRWLCNTDATKGPVYDKNRDGFVTLKVKRSKRSTAASSLGDIIELQVINGWFEYANAPGSAAIPFADSRNLGAASVGYAGLSSAQGPTNDGRYKPDLTAPGCVPTSVYGPCGMNNSYVATDVASAAAAGTAATFLSAFGPMAPWQLVQWFRNYAPTAWNGVGNPYPVWPNNVYGYGQMRVTTPDSPATTPTRFVSSSRRILDTRIASNARNTTAPLPPNSAMNMLIPDARIGMMTQGTVVLNVTIVKATGPGYVQVGPTGWSLPGSSSSLNVERAGQTIANVVVTPLGKDGAITIYVRGGGHLLIDVIGYFTTAYPSQGYVPLKPYRAYDTRCDGCSALTAKSTRDIQITGTGVADDVAAGIDTSITDFSVVVAVTADSPGASGFVSAVATTVEPPMPTSTTNFQAGLSSTGLSIASVSPSGKIRVYSSVATHLQVDVLGYFAAGIIGGDFIPVTPFRAIDTRQPAGALRPAAGAVSTPSVANGGIPMDAAAVIGNLTATNTDGPGELRIGATTDAANGHYRNSSVTAAGQVVATAITSGVAEGVVNIIATPSSHRLLDISGYFTPVARANNLDITPFPVDPAFPARFTVNPIMSADGNLVAVAQSPPLLPNSPAQTYMRLWDRTAGTVVTLDITVDDNPPDGGFTIHRISTDNQRILFSSQATNITPDDTSPNLDWFILDLPSNSVRRVNELPDGTRIEGGAFNRALTRMAFMSVDASGLLPEDTNGTWDTYEMDLTTNTLSYMIDHGGFSGNNGFNSDLTMAFIGNSVWRPGHARVPYPYSPSFSWLSDDGRYVLYEADLGSGKSVVGLFDAETATYTSLCTKSGYPGSTSPPVDWSSGPPSVGTWCTSQSRPGVQIIDANGQHWIAGSWTGLPLIRGSGQPGYVRADDVHDGRVALTSNASNLLPGVHPTSAWVFIYEPT